MKSAIYTKAGQVGLAEIDRPQIEAQDDAIIRIVLRLWFRPLELP